MTRFRQMSVAFGLSTLLAVIPSLVLATTPVAYGIVGAEYAATASTGRFAGVARAVDDRAAWWATVNHAALPTSVGGTGAITPGGGFALDGQVRDAAGAFTGGKITLLTTSDCGRQTYAVDGALAGTMTGTPSGAFIGGFLATLTHYRTRIFGRCITYAATVVGGVTLNVGA